ncbi:futalosine hydrolase [Alkalihalobacillus oceani]|uniref:futalosine hydrolase n=1 Tax=Halalkalibacter oceani TaxID=1653776 RepID=UPI0020409B95|nr:futalosine hydrolase [Halalkalibacter oceani]MCM3761169.1 futalosine hydrolase [Halalkalibacter oceani]
MNKKQRPLRCLIVTSVAAEKEAVERGFGAGSGVTVITGGVGQAAAAASTARELARASYDLVICAGIAGGFPERAEVGSIVVADRIIAADLGTESAEGFISIDYLQLGTTAVIETEHVLSGRLVTRLREKQLPVHSGPILTLSTVTGTAESATMLAQRVDGATAEGMEGYGVAVAATQFALPAMEIRTISNLVGPRDRGAWRIKEALAVLEQASAAFMEVIQ